MTIVTPPTPSGPYRSLVRAGPFAICSGQIGLLDGSLVPGGVGGQLRQAVANLAALLFGDGLTLGDVVKTTVFLADIADYDAMNAVYTELFSDPRPARSAIGVAGLPRGAAVEIEAWALVHSPGLGSEGEGFGAL